MPFTVAIAGITGRFSRCLVPELLKKPDVTIRGFARNVAKAPSSFQSSPRIQLVEGSSNDMDFLRTFVKGADIVVCAYAADNQFMVEGQKLLIDACETEEVPRFMASDYTIDYTKLEYGQLPSKDPMKALYEYLQGKAVKGVHILNGAFMDTFFSSWFRMFNLEDLSLSYWGTGEEVWESTTYENTAEFAASVVVDKNAIGFQRFLGDRKSIFQIAEVFEKVYNKKLSLKRLGSLDDLKKFSLSELQKDPSNFMGWLPWFYQYYCSNGQTYLDISADDAPSYPGLKRVTFEDYLRAHSIESLPTAMFTVGAS